MKALCLALFSLMLVGCSKAPNFPVETEARLVVSQIESWCAGRPVDTPVAVKLRTPELEESVFLQALSLELDLTHSSSFKSSSTVLLEFEEPYWINGIVIELPVLVHGQSTGRQLWQFLPEFERKIYIPDTAPDSGWRPASLEVLPLN